MKKRLVTLLFSTIIGVTSYAQYYGQHDVNTCPGKVKCGACYGTGVSYGYQCMSCGGTGVIQCPMCAGYRAGQQLAEREKVARWNNSSNCLKDGLSYFMEGEYGTALKYFKRSSSLGNARANMYIGEMYEFGFGVEGSKATAKKYYDKGAALGDVGCQNRVQRIRQYGYFEATAKNRRAYLESMQNASSWAYVTAKRMTDEIWGSSSSSSSSSSRNSSSRKKQSCSSCGGTGVDSNPNSGGSHFTWVAHYNSRGTQCRYCGKYTEHFHNKCASCNVPKY